MSIYFSLQFPFSAPLTSASFPPYFASLRESRDYTAPACSCRLTFLKHPPSPLPPQNLLFFCCCFVNFSGDACWCWYMYEKYRRKKLGNYWTNLEIEQKLLKKPSYSRPNRPLVVDKRTISF